jgi:hypothetical protein
MEEYMFKKATMVFIFISFITFWCTAQSTNYEPRLVGTWTNLEDGGTWVFNLDGTGTMSIGNKTVSFKFGAIDGRLVIAARDGFSPAGYDFYISKDGKTLILSAQGSSNYVLQKKT